MITKRSELPNLLNDLFPNGVGVEIGVQKGIHAENLCLWNFSKLYLVDPWISQSADEYVDIANVCQNKQDENYKTVVEKFSKDNRINILKMTSTKAVSNFPDNYFDFIYLDGRHDYDGVKEDLNNWYPKLKNCGMFAGHDYLDGKLKEGIFGVKSAVDEFFNSIPESIAPLRVTNEKWPTWFFFKEEKL